MSEAVFGYRNHVRSALLSAGSQIGEMVVTQLANEQGSPSTAWQTMPGVLTGPAGAWVRADLPTSQQWKLFALARTNLTPLAWVRWRVGSPGALFPVGTPVELTGRGTNTVANGPAPVDGGGTAPSYTNTSSSQAYISRAVSIGIGSFRARFKAQRITGTGTAGSALIVEFSNGTSVERLSVPMSAIPATGMVENTDLTFAAGGSGIITVYALADGVNGQVALWDLVLEPITALPYDSLSVNVTTGANTTRTGTSNVAGGAVAPTYVGSGADTYVRQRVTLPAGRVRVRARMQRMSGTNTTGSAITLEYHNGTSVVSASLAANQISPVGSFKELIVDNRVAGTYNLSFLQGAVTSSYAIWDAMMDEIPSYDSGLRRSNVKPGYQQTIVFNQNGAYGSSARVDIHDVTNPDGFVNVPFLYMGDGWQPRLNMSWSSSVGYDDEVEETVTRGGQEYPTTQWRRRRWDISHEAIARDDTWTQFMEMFRLSGPRGHNVLFVPDPDAEELNYEAVYGRIKLQSDLTWPMTNQQWRAARARITERL